MKKYFLFHLLLLACYMIGCAQKMDSPLNEQQLKSKLIKHYNTTSVQLTDLDNGYYQVQLANNMLGVCDNNGREIIYPDNQGGLNIFSTTICGGKKFVIHGDFNEGKDFLYDSEGKQVFSGEKILVYSDYIVVKEKGISRAYDSSYRLVIPETKGYRHIYYDKNKRHFVAYKGNKEIICNIEGDETGVQTPIQEKFDGLYVDLINIAIKDNDGCRALKYLQDQIGDQLPENGNKSYHYATLAQKILDQLNKESSQAVAAMDLGKCMKLQSSVTNANLLVIKLLADAATKGNQEAKKMLQLKAAAGATFGQPGNNGGVLFPIKQNNNSHTIRTCSMCHGKGWIPGNSTPTYGNTGPQWCEECKREVSMSHSHDVCPSCGGKGER